MGGRKALPYGYVTPGPGAITGDEIASSGLHRDSPAQSRRSRGSRITWGQTQSTLRTRRTSHQFPSAAL